MLWRLRDAPAIVRLLGVIHASPADRRIRYLVLELATDDLHGYMSYLYKRQRLTESGLRRIAIDILTGLAGMHAMSAYHRDLKPKNVLVFASADGSIAYKLGDVGESRIVIEGMLSQLTGFVGSPLYRAPETGGGDYDGRADVFSFGILLAELVLVYMAPGPPVDMNSAATRRNAFVARAVAFAEESGMDVLAMLIQGCCETDKGKRLTSTAALDLAKALQNDLPPQVCADACWLVLFLLLIATDDHVVLLAGAQTLTAVYAWACYSNLTSL